MRVALRKLWPFGHKRVLVLEDDTMMQKLVAKLLKSIHVRADVFGNGRDAIRKLATEGERYDALLFDLMMPHEGGLTVLRNLQEHQPALLRKVILMTGSGSSITNPWSDIIFAVVHKPFDSSALLDTVRDCFRQSESLVA
jgi:DNA-binding NtrC family response regulator